MIKLIAAVIMAIDHTGCILFPDIILFRLVGRLSMPLFAYSIARGYEYSRKRKTLKKYCTNLMIFSVISQVPYHFMACGLNIGVTWLFSLLLLIYTGERKKNAPGGVLACLAVVLGSSLCDADYGGYGVLMVLIMHRYMVVESNISRTFRDMVILWAFYVLFQKGSLLQIMSCAAILIIAAADRAGLDRKIRIPKQFFYIFYPVHIAVLLVIKNME